VAVFLVGMLMSCLGATPGRMSLHGHVPVAVAGLTAKGRLPATNQLSLAIGLPLRDAAGLDELLRQLYDPASTNFHKFLTPAEFTARFGPTEADYAVVRQFAETNGFTVTGTHANRVVLDVTAAAADVESALGVTLRTYRHPTENRDFFAPDTEPSVPTNLPVADMWGLSDFGRPHPNLIKRDMANVAPQTGSAPSGSGAYFGNDFRNAYVPGTLLTGAGQTVGLLQFDGFYASDIAAYATAAGNGRTNIAIQTVLLDGFTGVPTTGANSGNGEVSLDIEMAMSMAPGLTKIIVFEGNPNNVIPTDVLNAMAASNTVKNLSSSWAWGGGPNTTIDNIFKNMAAQGQSFFNAAGDSDAFPTGYVDNSANSTTPSSSPYITQVGGTTLTSGSGAAYSSEAVWNWGNEYGSSYNGKGSSGGISSYYSIPSWQTNISMAANGGSTTYRNIPDVALTADNVYVTYGNGTSAAFGGTSCAAPLWAGYCALINQQAVLAGKSPVGFVNPALYALAAGTNYNSVFHDVTSGNNTSSSSPSAFYAVAGYDLCTGLGTPNGTNLINALMPLTFSAVIAGAGWTLAFESATPTNGAIDPGETVTVNLSLQNQGNLATSNLVATLLASTNLLAPSGPQTYGALAAAGGSTNQPFTFTAAGTCGSSLVAALQLQDGTNNLGTVSFTLPLGSISTNRVQTFAQNFDGVTAPVLPAGWTTTNITGTTNKWATTTSASDTSPNSVFVADVASISENALVSPVISIAATNTRLSFRHNYSLEYTNLVSGHRHPTTNTTYYDGGVLEIQIGSGAFTDIVSAGGSFVTGGYNASITTTSDNPLGGRAAWVGSSSGWQTVAVNLPAAAAGQNIQLRWNYATDTGNSGTGAVGWYVDSISITDGVDNCLSVFTDLAISQTLATNSQPVGQNLVYTLTVTNLGPQAAANVMLTDAVPANATFVAATGGSYSAGQMVWPVGMLAAATATNFTITLAPATGNIFTNFVSIGTVTPEITLTNNAATLVTTQIVSLQPSITSIATSAGGGLKLQLTGAAAQTYVLEVTTNLFSANWQPVATNTLDNSGQWQFNNPPATNTPNCFYRLKLVQQ